MFRNLKNKNVLMILLLLLILVSVFSYNMIQTTVEGFTSEDLGNYFDYMSTNGNLKFYKLKEAEISADDLATIRSNYYAERIRVLVMNAPNSPTWPKSMVLQDLLWYLSDAEKKQEEDEINTLKNEITKLITLAAMQGDAYVYYLKMDMGTNPPSTYKDAGSLVSVIEILLNSWVQNGNADQNAIVKVMKVVRDAIAAEESKGMNIIIGFNSGPNTKVYDLESRHLSNFNLTIRGDIIIKDGKLAEKVVDIIKTTATITTAADAGTTTADAGTTTADAGTTTADAGADAASVGTGITLTTAQLLELVKDGDTDIVLPERDTTYSTSSMKDVVLDYLLGNSGASFQDSGYYAPHYNSFESAMSTPSNPIVNPVNSMNPLDYSQSLFGPNVTPTMMQNMCKNSNTNNFSDFKNGNDSEAEDGDEDEYGDGSEANNGSTNGSGANNGSNNGYEANNGSEATNGSELQQPQTYSTSNMDSNTCQNCNGQQNSNNTCSSCENKNSILNGGGYSPHLPRPVLTNFSNFGN